MAKQEPYRGEYLRTWRAIRFPWSQSNAVVVSGAGPNFCGHAMLNAGHHYFHIDGLHDYPLYMDEIGYKRFLKENGKREISRHPVSLSNPEGAQRKLEELSAKRWLWLILPHNFAAYIEEIFRAGGSKSGIFSNCPVAWTWQ